MKVRFHILILALAVFLSGCLSTQARQDILFPSLIAAYQGVSQDIAYGVEAKAAAGEPTTGLGNMALSFGQALQTRDVTVVALQVPNWIVLRDVAKQGIEAQVLTGAIGPGVADSLRTRLIVFEGGLATLLSGLPQSVGLTGATP